MNLPISPDTPVPLGKKLLGVLRWRCPACWTGPMFARPWQMHDRCPHCKYQFDKGNGYFIGAMYSSYALSLGLAMLLAVGLFLAGFTTAQNLTVVGLVLTLVGPLVILPYSRVIWVWVERDGWLHDGQEDVARLRREHAERGGLPSKPKISVLPGEREP